MVPRKRPLSRACNTIARPWHWFQSSETRRGRAVDLVAACSANARPPESDIAAVPATDISGDGKLDLLACLGARNKPKPQDGVYWYEIPSDPKAGSWVRRRLSDPSQGTANGWN